MEKIHIDDIVVCEKCLKSGHKHSIFSYKNILRMCKSIKRNPNHYYLTIDQNNVLVKGFLRYLAFKKLNFIFIPCKIIGEDY